MSKPLESKNANSPVKAPLSLNGTVCNLPIEVAHFFISEKKPEALRLFLHWKFNTKISGDGQFLYRPELDCQALGVSLSTLYRLRKFLIGLKVIKPTGKKGICRAASWGRCIAEIRKRKNPNQLVLGKCDTAHEYFARLGSNNVRSFTFNTSAVGSRQLTKAQLYACFLRKSCREQTYRHISKVSKRVRNATKAAIAKTTQCYLSSDTVATWFDCAKVTGHRAIRLVSDWGLVDTHARVEDTGLPVQALEEVAESILHGFAYISKSTETVHIQHPTQIAIPNPVQAYGAKDYVKVLVPVRRTIRFPYWYR